MNISVLKSGLQTTLQSRPRIGQRHLGVPTNGPADPLSMALANRLVGNAAVECALETTLTGATLRFLSPTFVAITGAVADCSLNGSPVEQHSTIAVRTDDVLVVGAALQGARSYIAFAGGLSGDELLGSTSTCLTAGFGGHAGRALEDGDELRLANDEQVTNLLKTPAEYRLPMLDSWTLRAGRSCESSLLPSPLSPFDRKLTVSSRNDRMGVKLDGERFELDSDAQMPSVPVFPGTVQCPQDGSLYILCVDSGTTGGYPRVAKIARMDLHALGQLRPGNSITLIERDDETAAIELLEKQAYWKPWIPDIADIV